MCITALSTLVTGHRTSIKWADHGQKGQSRLNIVCTMKVFLLAALAFQLASGLVEIETTSGKKCNPLMKENVSLKIYIKTSLTFHA